MPESLWHCFVLWTSLLSWEFSLVTFPELGDHPLFTVSPTEGQSSTDPTLAVDGTPGSLYGGAARTRGRARRAPAQASRGRS